MPSPPLIEIDELLAPIPGDSPAGGPVPFAVSKKLEDSRKEVRRSDFAEDDPRRPEMDQKPEWGVVTHLATENNVLLTGHPLVAGVPNPFSGGYASHSSFCVDVVVTMIASRVVAKVASRRVFASTPSPSIAPMYVETSVSTL